MSGDFDGVIARLWQATGPAEATGPAQARATGPGAASAPLDRLTVAGPRSVLESVLDVTGLATASVAVATLAAAQLLALRRSSEVPAVRVESREACAAFAAEALFTPVGWQRAPLWDPIAGNYRAADGWVRLHTNYARHRVAVESALGCTDREAIAKVVARMQAEDVESAVVASGGAAAAMHRRADWLASAAGAAVATAPLVAVSDHPAARPVTSEPGGGGSDAGWASTNSTGPFDGLRVLDLTRVIAGPVCTKFLAGYGADVLRIDPPGFEEVTSLLPETTLGKRTAALDLTADHDREVFEQLVAGADVLVCGLRAGALPRLGYDDERLGALNPGLVVGHLDAYGWTGPWRDRRGFDSLVQMSCGIAAAGAAQTGLDRPVPLPVQALDHATGWLLAAAIARSLARRLRSGVAPRLRMSLAGTADLLYSMAPPGGIGPAGRPAVTALADVPLEKTTTAWGPARRAPLPGQISGVEVRWRHEAGPLGRHGAAWAGNRRP